MDALDESILEELSKKALSLKKLSKKLQINPSTLHRRIKKLESLGVIKKYKAEIDWKKAGFDVKAYILIYVDTSLLKKLNKNQKSIKKEIEKFYFVDECSIITGEADLIVKMRAKTNEDLGRLLTEYLHGIEGIVKTKTLVCLD